MVSSTTVRIDWTIFMAEFNWNSIFWDPWISWRITRFLSSNGKQEWVHKSPRILISIHKCKSWWKFENMYRLPYNFWNCSQNLRFILLLYNDLIYYAVGVYEYYEIIMINVQVVPWVIYLSWLAHHEKLKSFCTLRPSNRDQISYMIVVVLLSQLIVWYQ